MAYNLTAVLRIQDKLTAPLRRMMTSVKSMEKVTNAANTKLNATTKAVDGTAKATAAYTSGAAKASAKVRTLTADNNKLATSAQKASKAMSDAQNNGTGGSKGGGLLSSLGKSALTGAVGGVTAGITNKVLNMAEDGIHGVTSFIGDSANKAIAFESQLLSIQALTGASSDDMKLMTNLALDMGAKTKYSALQAAQGIEELVKAGMDPATVKAGGLEAALNLATAGGLDLASAAEIMSTSLNAFYKDGMSAADASNILAGTANASATGVDELKFSLAAVGAVAGGIGMTFKDTNAALGVFANKGLKGSDAGTSLKTMLGSLQPTTKDAISVMKGLGIITKSGANQFYTAAGKVKSFAEISEILKKSMSKLTDMQRQQALETMFGSDAVRAANIAFEVGADGVKSFYEEMGKVTALEVAQKKMDGAGGAIEQFQGALETLQIRALTPMLPAIKNVFNGMGDIIDRNSPKIISALTTATDMATKYIDDNFVNNQAFRDLSFTAKIQFIFDKALEAFNNWYDAGGKDELGKIGAKISGFLADMVKASAPQLTEIGVLLGSSLGKGLINGFVESIPIVGKIIKSIGTPTTPEERAKDGITNPLYHKDGLKIPGADAVYKAGDALLSGFKTKDQFWDNLKATSNNVQSQISGAPKKATGLERVPYNGMPIIAHKDEMLLNKTEADRQRSGKNGGGNVMVTGNTFHVRQESDIDAIARSLARQVWDARSAVTP